MTYSYREYSHSEFTSLPRRSVDACVKVVVEWMQLCWPNAPENLADPAHSLPRRLPLVVELGADVDKSYVVRGVVLRAGLACAQMPVWLANVKFVVLRCELKSSSRSPSCSHTVVASTVSDADYLRQVPFHELSAFLQSLRSLHVNVVITTEHERFLYMPVSQAHPSLSLSPARALSPSLIRNQSWCPPPLTPSLPAHPPWDP